MGCCGGPEDPTQEIDLTYKGNEVDNEPYEKLERAAAPDAWKAFAKTDHNPPDEEGPEPSGEVEDLENPITIGKGDMYVGSFNKSKKLPEGFGVMAFKETGNMHQGYFHKGKAQGPGILFIGKGPLKGSKVVGHFKQGYYEGLCKITSPNGNEYLGSIKKNQKSGKGKETTKKGEVYEGYFAGDKRQGWGLLTKPDGSSYEGEWKNGAPEGVGKSVDKNGNTKFKMFSRGTGKKEIDEGAWESKKPDE